MHRFIRGTFSFTLALVACSSDSSTPTPFEATVPALRIARQSGFGTSPGISLARATVEEGFECGLGPAGSTTDSRVVFTSSGNVTLVCRANTGEGPKPAFIVKNELCEVFAGVTDDMHFVWAPSGRATLVCHLTH
jgi:hypothetical protein